MPLNFMFLSRLLPWHFQSEETKEGLEGGHGSFPPVEAKNELCKVILEILGIDAVMSAVEPRFEAAQSPVDMQRMRFGWPEFMPIGGQGRGRVSFPLVGANFGSRLDIFLQIATNRSGIRPGCDCESQPAGLFHLAIIFIGAGDHLHRAKNEGAVGRLCPAQPFFTSEGSPNNDLVRFHSAAQAEAGLVDHRAAQAMQQVPGGFVAASHLPLQLDRAHAGGVRGHEIRGPEPLTQRKVRPMQHRARGNRSLTGTLAAFINMTPGLAPIGVRSAMRANKTLRPPALGQVVEAGCFLGKLLTKFFQSLGEARSRHPVSLKKVLRESTG
jgi:hypothetical protein